MVSSSGYALDMYGFSVVFSPNVGDTYPCEEYECGPSWGANSSNEVLGEETHHLVYNIPRDAKYSVSTLYLLILYYAVI